MWKDDDRLENYREEAKKSMWDSITSCASRGADIGGTIGSVIGLGGLGRAAGGVIGGVIGAITSIFDW